MSELNQHQTEDLAFAAYLRVRGYALIRVEKLQPNRTDSKRRFIFKVPPEALSALLIEYVNSELLRFYHEIIGLKKL